MRGSPDPLTLPSCLYFSRLWQLLRANANDLVSRAEDPAKILDQALMDMQADLVKLRQAVATAKESPCRWVVNSDIFL